MKIALLSRNSTLYSTQRLQQAAQERKHEVQIIDILRCSLSLNNALPQVYYHGQVLDDFDAIIPRIGTSVSYEGIAVVRQFELMKVYTVSSAQALSLSRDKLQTAQLFIQHGVPIPHSAVVNHREDIKSILPLLGTAPTIVKLVQGTQGLGVILAETQQLAESVIQGFLELKAHILLQEFITEARGCDIRCFVIGDEVVAAMQRQAANGEFRSNLHRGGSSSAVELSETETQLAIKAAQVLGSAIAGVDLLRTKQGAVVLEVNSSPGLEGIEAISGKNIGELVIKFIEQQLESRNTP